MNTIISLLAILAGLLLRLAIPIAVTAVFIYFLRKLDTRWQLDAQIPAAVEKPECWKINGCTPEQRTNCVGASSFLPCWQVYRLPNGYLREECLSCEVFINAPAPLLAIEPRRM
jgi:hypothetical protein